MHKCTNGHLTVVHDQEDEFKTFLHGMGYLNKKCQMFTMPGPKTSLSLLCCLALVLKNKIFTLLHQSFSRSLHNIYQKQTAFALGNKLKEDLKAAHVSIHIFSIVHMIRRGLYVFQSQNSSDN